MPGMKECLKWTLERVMDGRHGEIWKRDITSPPIFALTPAVKTTNLPFSTVLTAMRIFLKGPSTPT